jgi:HEAT repeat protein
MRNSVAGQPRTGERRGRANHARRAFAAVRVALFLGLALAGGCSKAQPSAETTRGITWRDWTQDLSSPDETTRWKAAIGLAEMGQTAKPALPALIAAINDPSRIVRERAVWALVHVDPTGNQVLIHLYTALKDADPGVRTTAVRAIGKLGASGEPAIPELERLLLDPAPSVRMASVQTLADLGPLAQRSVRYLIDVSNRDPDPAVRQAATDAAMRLTKE